MRRRLRRNGLTLVCFGLFLTFLGIQSVTGNREYNENQLSVYLRQKGSPESKPVSHPHSETGG